MRETQTIDKVRIYAVAIYVTRDSCLLYQESSIKKKGLIMVGKLLIQKRRWYGLVLRLLLLYHNCVDLF